MHWDKQPAYEMGKQSGAWGSDKNRNKAPDTRSNHSSGHLRYLERQLVDQRKALRQLEEECEAERQCEYRNQSQQGRLSESVETNANERQIERDRQRQSDQSLFQR